MQIEETQNSLTFDQRDEKMVQLCKAKAIVDILKAELKTFMQEGETFACEYGKLTLGKEGQTFSWNTAGEPHYEAFKMEAESKGWGKFSVTKPALRLTSNKEFSKKVLVDLFASLSSDKACKGFVENDPSLQENLNAEGISSQCEGGNYD